MVTSLLVSLWAGICAIDDIGTQMIRRPLLISTVVGLIMGDLQTGLLIGATLEVMWMGVGNVGAYSAPDIITGSAIGTALGILSGGTATAVALAVPTSLLAQQLLILYRSGIVYLNPIANRIAETGNFKKVFRIQYVPMILAFLVRAVPTFLAIYFGAGAIDTAVEALPDSIMDGLSIAGSIIPAVGIGLLMLMMIKKGELWVFLIAGFALAVYLDLSVLPITLIALPLAYLYDLATREKETKPESKSKDSDDFDDDEEDYDL
ncbi:MULTISPECIES: PTS mannose/fructose/sorbose/N-acetylgalactosamine transporter subunit IIC [Oceanobacillus]|uniref:PTS mannose transporter subunit IICD n=1 Tax=Oceanobacillus neutriphilus TaxID=531815 RepID=A0ABQ2NTG9_9BACI|nr:MULTISPECIES: PTS sugar transporter subunit IIC [Oceanobacillus]MCT1902073.1 PTS sugar transporter subunit IIC [Oceanobacillus sojae]GGP07519.1 PTS mannose transporter subunit IICD [Oceanobacillus neutriphilus]